MTCHSATASLGWEISTDGVKSWRAVGPLLRSKRCSLGSHLLLSSDSIRRTTVIAGTRFGPHGIRPSTETWFWADPISTLIQTRLSFPPTALTETLAETC